MKGVKMSFPPLLLFHICAGTLGVLSGFVTIFLRKGSRGHRLAGNVFFTAMLCLGASGAVLGFMKSQPTNVLAGILTCYLVTTAWMTARRRDEGTRIFDFGALLLALTVGSGYMIYGLAAAHNPTGLRDGVPAAMLFVMASVALLAAVGDARMLVRGGVSGAQRLARHLWRMCFALFIAAASVFMARQRLFPGILRQTGVLYLLSFLPLILMIFWLIRVRVTKAYKKMPLPSSGRPARGLMPAEADAREGVIADVSA
jgi:Predicted membrane protein (DUF2306)